MPAMSQNIMSLRESDSIALQYQHLHESIHNLMSVLVYRLYNKPGFCFSSEPPVCICGSVFRALDLLCVFTGFYLREQLCNIWRINHRIKRRVGNSQEERWRKKACPGKPWIVLSTTPALPPPPFCLPEVVLVFAPKPINTSNFVLNVFCFGSLPCVHSGWAYLPCNRIWKGLL